MKDLTRKTQETIKLMGRKIRTFSEVMAINPLVEVFVKGREFGEDRVYRGAKKYLTRGEKLKTIVELTETFIKVAQVIETRDRQKPITLRARNCLGLSDQEIINVLTELLPPEGGGRGDVTLLIPISQVISRTVRFPTHDENEIREIMRYRVVHEVPLAPENIVYGYRITSKDSDGYSTSNLFIVKRVVIDRYIDMLKAAHLEPDSVKLNIEGIANFIRSRSPEIFDEQEEISAIIDIDQDITNIGFIVKGKLIFTRYIPVGAGDLLRDSVMESLPERKRSVEFLQDEMLRTFGLFSKEAMQQRVARIILCGVPEVCQAMGEGLEETFNLSVEEIYPVTSKDLKSLSTGEEEQTVQVKGFSMASVIGQAVSGRLEGIDLLPAEYVAKKRQRSRRRDFLKTAALALILLVITALIAERELSKREQHLGKLEEEITTILPVTTRVEGIESRLEMIGKRIENKGLTLVVLREVHSLLPSDISLSLFSYTGGKTVVLKGTAMRMSDVFALVPKLEKSDHFRNVSVGYASKRATGGDELTDFQINMMVEKVRN
jgi:Tfp pilus assembly PilM family ATPase